MKRIITTLALMSLIIVASAQKLIVKVDGIRSNKGKIMIGLGDYQNNPKGMIGKSVDADPNGVEVVFDSLPDNAKVYVYHVEKEEFNPLMIAQLMQNPVGGFGLDASGSWQPQANIPGQTINFKLYYMSQKTKN